MISRFDRYILAAVIQPLMMMLAIAVMLLLLDQMLRLFQFVLEENGSVNLVWRMLASLIPEYISLALPIGFFLGALFATRRLSLSSEIDASFAAGVSLRRLLSPMLGLAAVLTLLNLLIVGFAQPFASYQYSRLAFDVRSSFITAQVKDGAVLRLGDAVTLRVGAAGEGERPWRSIFLERCESGGVCTAVLAESGRLMQSADGSGRLVLRLYRGRQVEIGPEGPSPGYLGFEVGDFSLERTDPGVFRGRGDRRQEVTFTEIISGLAGDDLSDKRRAELTASLHWRILHSLLLLALPFFGVALGVADKRNDSGFGFIFGLVGVILYYRLLQASEAAVAAGQGTPLLGMWPIFLVFLVTSVALFWACSERVGFKPFAPLESLVLTVREWAAARLRVRRARSA